MLAQRNMHALRESEVCLYNVYGLLMLTELTGAALVANRLSQMLTVAHRCSQKGSVAFE